MSRAAVTVLALVAFAAAPPATGTQTATIQPPRPAAPPRDNSQVPSGTSRIRGRVFAADTNQPVRKALIRISAPELREMRTTSTDPEGKYEFRDLPAGRYSVIASKGAYVTLSYGQTRAFEQGRPLEVADNQTVDKIDFTLPRGSIITGRVLDEYGDPVADAQVAPMRMQFTPQGRRPAPVGRFGSTNDIGEFRLFGLAPGPYLLSATLRSFDGFGSSSDDRSGYAPTYYPGTANISEAQTVAVGIGETLNDITVMLVPTRTARISGIVLDTEGNLVKSGSILVVQRTNQMFFANSGGQIRPDGSFSVGGLAPGEYTLRAQVGAPGSNGPTEVATANVTVDGGDVDGIRLAPTRLVLISGKVVTDPRDAPLKPGIMRFTATSKNPADGVLGLAQAPQIVNDDLTFELKAYPGLVGINVMGVVPGWMIKAVRLNGADVMDSGFEVRANEDVSGLEVEMTNRLSELSGAVTDDRGRPVIDYTAIAYPQERAASENIVRSSVGRPDQDGRFKFRPLRAGSYYVVAVDYVEQGQWLDPDYLERLRADAIRVVVGDGETKTVDLKLLSPR